MRGNPVIPSRRQKATFVAYLIVMAGVNETAVSRKFTYGFSDLPAVGLPGSFRKIAAGIKIN
jgi:hypothetical protein